jgi:ribosomal-protein-alanine N-acetyltransferase
MNNISIVYSADTISLHKQAYSIFCGHRDSPWQFTTFEKALMLPNSLIAIINNECVGYALITVVLGEVEIEDICALPDLRRQGIASTLLSHVISDANRRCDDSILLEVAQQNKPAQALYEKHGFAPITIRKNYYRLANNTFDDALLLKRVLP